MVYVLEQLKAEAQMLFMHTVLSSAIFYSVSNIANDCKKLLPHIVPKRFFLCSFEIVPFQRNPNTYKLAGSPVPSGKS